MTTYCDINTCEDCPRYGDDCDGDKRVEHTDLISRADAIEAVASITMSIHLSDVICDKLLALPSAEAVHGEWIPCSKKMPKELERVNVTWLNHNPPFYYQHIKDIPQTDTAVYYRGKWYWWDATVIDILAEYGEDCNAEQIDKDIEVVAWMPLPKPYRESREKYELATEQMEHDAMYEPTYSSEDGSM